MLTQVAQCTQYDLSKEKSVIVHVRSKEKASVTGLGDERWVLENNYSTEDRQAQRHVTIVPS